MRILLDECVDQRFRRGLAEHEVSTVPEAGWSGKSNGELLAIAAERFEASITVDRNLYFQQNVAKFRIAVLVLAAKSNRLADLKALIPSVLRELSHVRAGEVRVIFP